MIFVFFYSRTNFFEVIPILFCGTMLGDIIPFIFGLDPPKVAFVGDISPFMGKSGIYIKKISFWKKYIYLFKVNKHYVLFAGCTCNPKPARFGWLNWFGSANTYLNLVIGHQFRFGTK